MLDIISLLSTHDDSSLQLSWPIRVSALDCSSFTSLTLQRRSPVSLPHHWVLQTHRATASLLLRLVPVYVSHTHPASSGPWPARLGADSPLGVVLAGLEGERLPWVDDLDIQNLPAQRAVGGEDACGANPELDQEVWLEGGGHPGVVQVWWGREGGWTGTCFYYFIACKLNNLLHQINNMEGELLAHVRTCHALIGPFIPAKKLKVKLTQDEEWPEQTFNYFHFSKVVPLSKEAPLAKLMKLVPSFEVRVTLRLDTVLMCGKMWPDGCFFSQTAASAGTRDAKDSGTSQSYTLGWLIWSCSPVVQKKLDLRQTPLTALQNHFIREVQ